MSVSESVSEAGRPAGEGAMDAVKKRLNGQKAGKLAGFLLFLLLAFGVFSTVTYLFRNTGYDRSHVVGIQKEGPLDVVYVGSSSAHVYWQPLKAWRDCGFTSYSLSTNSLQAEAVRAYMEEALPHHPKLFVVDVRPFQFYNDEEWEGSLRDSTDSMDLLSPARFHLLRDYFSHRRISESTDVLSYYFDIAKYHTKTENLSDPAAWEFWRNNGRSVNKGWEWNFDQLHEYLEPPRDFETQARGELPENSVRILNQLLDWCRGKDFEVLFVVCPYHMRFVDMKDFNTIRDMVERAGYRFLNAAEHYVEIGLDFATDYYNTPHVNVLGARKYTAWLEKFIQDTYALPDHRGEEAYAAWDQDADRFAAEEREFIPLVLDRITEEIRGEDILARMRRTASFEDWSLMAKDDRFILLVGGKNDFAWPQGAAARAQLHAWGISGGEQVFLRVLQNGELLYTSEEFRERDKQGYLSWLDYRFGYDDQDRGYLFLEGKDYGMPDGGITVTVLDANFKKAVGRFWIHEDGKGGLTVSDTTDAVDLISPDYGIRGTDVDLSDASRLALRGAEVIPDAGLGRPGVLCTGRLPRDPEDPADSLQAWLLEEDYVGFSLELEDAEPWRFLLFNGRKVAGHGQPTVFAYDDAGNVVSRVVATHDHMDNETVLYRLDLTDLSGPLYIVFNGGYIDESGSEASSFLFSDLRLY